MSKQKQSRTRRTEYSREIAEMQAIRENLGKAYACFNVSTDPSLTEASIFEINALRAHYDHALRNIKLRSQDCAP